MTAFFFNCQDATRLFHPEISPSICTNVLMYIPWARPSILRLGSLQL